ncbi:hypothetical protein E2562_033674, partial [Oryza meyeriana var. granulata]
QFWSVVWLKKGNVAHVQGLLKWTNLPADHATWEDYEVAKQRFPSSSSLGASCLSWGKNVAPDQDGYTTG